VGGEADIEAKPHPIPLRREEGLEDESISWAECRIPGRLRICAIFSIRQLGAHEKPAPNCLDVSHRVAAVDNEVEQHLAGIARRRFSNLTQLAMDTSWWTRYRSRTDDPNFGANEQTQRAKRAKSRSKSSSRWE
jgi:hypothetical protein